MDSEALLKNFHSEISSIKIGHYVAFFIQDNGGEMWDSYGNNIHKFNSNPPFKIFLSSLNYANVQMG